MAEKIMLSHQVRGVDLSCLAVVSVLKLLKHTTRAHTHTHTQSIFNLQDSQCHILPRSVQFFL